MPSLRKTKRTKRDYDQYGYEDQGPRPIQIHYEQYSYEDQGPLINGGDYDQYSYEDQGPLTYGEDYDQYSYEDQGPLTNEEDYDQYGDPIPTHPGQTWSHEACYDKEYVGGGLARTGNIEWGYRGVGQKYTYRFGGGGGGAWTRQSRRYWIHG